MQKKSEFSDSLLTELKGIEGFPDGNEENIIFLSDPPVFTACPNPWISEFISSGIKEFGTTHDYDQTPYTADVSEGKNDPIYNVHSYHTKVPHKAIMRYLLHYTSPGDIVLDGFCGTGMTGVASYMCGHPDNDFKKLIEKENSIVEWGVRKAILSDLSPAATFIAYGYNNPIKKSQLFTDASGIALEVEKECGWLFETYHVIEGNQQYQTDIQGEKVPIIGKINYIIWSDVFICPSCMKDIIFWDIAIKPDGTFHNDLSCPFCEAIIEKKDMERVRESVYDDSLQQTVTRAKQVPVKINYSITDSKGKTIRCNKAPDGHDLDIIQRILSEHIPYWYPTRLMHEGELRKHPERTHGITHVHQYYTKRNLWIFAALFHRAKQLDHKALLFVLSAIHLHINRMRIYQPVKPGGTPKLQGTFFIPTISVEVSPLDVFPRKLRDIGNMYEMMDPEHHACISTGSSGDLRLIPSESIDYIFIDPPFGGNLQYAELNYLWESWLGVTTNDEPEAIITKYRQKGLSEYQTLMESCFREFYRVLKPGRWMTVEFHNSKNSVWMAIQEGLMKAGFVVADVRVLDKKQGTFYQKNTPGAVKQDLIITSYKPEHDLETHAHLASSDESTVWEFIHQHLGRLPIVDGTGGIIRIIEERKGYLLFDRMVAFFVQRGAQIPISSGDFYAGLKQRYPERDGMYFLDEQVATYDKQRIKVDRIEQTVLFVHDERSTVQWLTHLLSDKQMTYQEIQPLFLRVLHLDKFEKLPELADILEQYFLKTDEERWYTPDPSRLSDLEKMRERALLREFDTYRTGKGRLKLFRTEAIRAGFRKAWTKQDYQTIILIGQRLPENILQEDDQLLMYYDNAMTRGGS
ncbi:DNA methylase [anaerobic digester metagenome]